MTLRMIVILRQCAVALPLFVFTPLFAKLPDIDITVCAKSELPYDNRFKMPEAWNAGGLQPDRKIQVPELRNADENRLQIPVETKDDEQKLGTVNRVHFQIQNGRAYLFSPVLKTQLSVIPPASGRMAKFVSPQASIGEIKKPDTSMKVNFEEVLLPSEVKEFENCNIFPECTRVGFSSVTKLELIDKNDLDTGLSYYVIKLKDGTDVLAVRTYNYFIIGSSAYCPTE